MRSTIVREGVYLCGRCGGEYEKGTYSSHRFTHAKNKPFRVLTEKHKEVVALIDEGLTLKQVGDYLGITRERVRQIYTKATGHGVDKARLPHVPPKQNTCAICGEKWMPGTWVVHCLANHPDRRWNTDPSKIAIYPARSEKIRELFDRGLPYKEIGDRLGMGRSAIHQALNRMGLRRYTPRREGYIEAREAILHDWLVNGLSRSALEKKYPGRAIYYIMRGYRGEME